MVLLFFSSLAILILVVPALVNWSNLVVVVAALASWGLMILGTIKYREVFKPSGFVLFSAACTLGAVWLGSIFRLSDVEPIKQLLVISTIAINTAFVEEVIFRQVLINKLTKFGLKPVLVVIASAVVFSSVHVFSGYAPIHTIAGLVLAWIYLKTKSLFLVSCVHFLSNTMAYSLTGYSETFPKPLLEVSCGPSITMKDCQAFVVVSFQITLLITALLFVLFRVKSKFNCDFVDPPK
jgi:membrane protease YdiL (CAAX protease family)